MGLDPVSWVAIGAVALGAGATAYTALGAEDPKSAKELEQKATREAEKKKKQELLAQQTSGQTVFSSPAGSGMSARSTLG